MKILLEDKKMENKKFLQKRFEKQKRYILLRFLCGHSKIKGRPLTCFRLKPNLAI